MKETAEQRSRIMRAVKGSDTAPEMTVRQLVHRMGYRFRLHRKDLPGKPDLVFPGLHKVVFVNGCFWHGHDCARGARTPKANAEYWRGKITRNSLRDASNLASLEAKGWRAAVIWECELKDPAQVKKRLAGFLGHTLRQRHESRGRRTA
jgi:DNA mismatch endonuclease (patch repair protein)